MTDRDKLYNLIEEFTNRFEFIDDYNELETKIEILIPKKFRNIWLIKLSDLQTSLREIEEYE